MALIDTFGAEALAAAALAFLLGGFVKGVVGFALPLIAVTFSASVLPAEVAVAAVILPVLLSNAWQAGRQGLAALSETGRRFWPMNLALGAMIWVGAAALPGLDDRVFFALLGVGAGAFAAAELVGWRPRLRPERERGVGVGVGLLSGFIGGISGIWGPPTVMYLLALGVEKREQMRATGLSFLIGSVMLAPAHLATGALNGDTALLSASMIAPVLLGQALGQAAQDRLDQALFRKITLVVLCLAALNLLRRAAFG